MEIPVVACFWSAKVNQGTNTSRKAQPHGKVLDTSRRITVVKWKTKRSWPYWMEFSGTQHYRLIPIMIATKDCTTWALLIPITNGTSFAASFRWTPAAMWLRTTSTMISTLTAAQRLTISANSCVYTRIWGLGGWFPGSLIEIAGSMYGIFTYIYHKNQPNVGKYTIHGCYGLMHFQWGSRSVFFWLRQSQYLHPANVQQNVGLDCHESYCWWFRDLAKPVDMERK